jgi:hypothetical protein
MLTLTYQLFRMGYLIGMQYGRRPKSHTAGKRGSAPCACTLNDK